MRLELWPAKASLLWRKGILLLERLLLRLLLAVLGLLAVAAAVRSP